MPELDLPIALDYDGALEARLFDDIRVVVAPNIPVSYTHLTLPTSDLV